MSLPSKKYKKQLLGIKKQLLQEIASRLTDGRFEMKEITTIAMKIPFGECFRGQFDIVEGDKNQIRLYKKSMDFIPQLSFSDNEDAVVEDEISALMALLDYMDMDSRK